MPEYEAFIIRLRWMRVGFGSRFEWMANDNFIKCRRIKQRTAHPLRGDIMSVASGTPNQNVFFCSDFFFRRCTQTYLALNQMRNAYLFIHVVKSAAWSVHLLLMAKRHFCNLLKSWYRIIRAFVRLAPPLATSTSCTHRTQHNFPCRRWRAAGTGFWF